MVILNVWKNCWFYILNLLIIYKIMLLVVIAIDTLQYNSTAISLSANERVDLCTYRSHGTFAVVQDQTFVRLTYLSNDN